MLSDQGGHVYGIDHGLCFSADFKLRTVIWEFSGEEIPAPALQAVERVVTSLPLDISSLLEDDEITALCQRGAWMLEHRQFPVDESGQRYPWPLV